MTKTPKLKLPLWSELVYFVFIAIVPTILAACEIFSSHSTVFKITFSSVGSILLVVVIIKKFVYNEKIKKHQQELINLEHDYSIEVGNKNNIEQLWAFNNIVIYCYNAIVTLLVCLLMYLFITALSEQLIQFRVASLLIFTSVIVALAFKLAVYIGFMKRAQKEADKGVENEARNKQVQQ